MPEYFLSYEKEPLLDYWVLGSQDMHSGVQSIDSLGQTVPCIKYDETLALFILYGDKYTYRENHSIIVFTKRYTVAFSLYSTIIIIPRTNLLFQIFIVTIFIV